MFYQLVKFYYHCQDHSQRIRPILQFRDFATKDIFKISDRVSYNTSFSVVYFIQTNRMENFCFEKLGACDRFIEDYFIKACGDVVLFWNHRRKALSGGPARKWFYTALLLPGNILWLSKSPESDPLILIWFLSLNQSL